MDHKKTVLITGASSGIGEETAYKLAKRGYSLALCARRIEKLETVAKNCENLGSSVYFESVDVTIPAQREAFVNYVIKKFGKIDVLFNNAGLALGLEDYCHSDSEDVKIMFETNVIAVMEMTKLVLPKMIEDGNGHLVFMGSVAGHQSYENGSGYCGSKHALRAMINSLRQEIAAHPIRISSIDPGLVDTEFSLVRFRGDKDKAESVYDGIHPLLGEDIAECVDWVISRPPHVNISEIDVFPVHQADARKVVRN
jgi:3-hydroxy acid dehydrogenase / malonic semialdehyde reductase